MKNVPATRYWSFLRTYLGGQRKQVGIMGGLILLGLSLELINPQIISRFIDNALAGAETSALLGIASLYLAFAILNQLGSVAANYVAANVGFIATNQLRAKLALHALTLDASYHNRHTPGELIERVDGDVGTLNNFFSRFLVELLGNVLLLIGVLGVLFLIDWRVGLALTLFALFTLVVVNRLSDIAVPHWRQVRETIATLYGFLEERLAGTEDIRANGAVSFTINRLFMLARELLRREIRAELIGMAAYGTGLVLFMVGAALSLGMGVWLFQEGTITIGMVYVIFRYAELLQTPLEQINRQIQDLQQAGASLLRIQEMLSETSALTDGDGRLPEIALDVSFDAVSFGYNPDEFVLRDVTFKLGAGRVLGLLGRTGSGKTSLTRLLFRLYDPTSGAIRVGKQDLRSLQLANLRKSIGMVTQQIQLFNASVRDNLTFFDDSVPDERIVVALRELGLGNWYEALPDGLDTRLAPGGKGLSAGEAQLLAFVRVFLEDPHLIILDEASSRLDPATEQRLEHAIAKLLEGRTAIIIAHRLATVQRVDEIMILEQGEILERGDRTTLAEDPDSRFAHLLQVGLSALETEDAIP